MYKIFIDATERYNKIVKLIKVVKDKERVVASKEGDLDIVSTISQLLKDKKLESKDIGIVESNPGPGSFTGLKISSTISNVLNWALKRKKSNELGYPNYGREPNITLKKDV